MSFSRDKSSSAVDRGGKFGQGLRTSWWRWIRGISDDNLNGVELGTLRVVPCPVQHETTLPKQQSPPVSPFVQTSYPQMDVESVKDSEMVDSDVSETLIPSPVIPVSEKETHCNSQSKDDDLLSVGPSKHEPSSPIDDAKTPCSPINDATTPCSSIDNMSSNDSPDVNLSSPTSPLDAPTSPTSQIVTPLFSSEEDQEFNFLIRFANDYLKEQDQLKQEDSLNCLETCSQGAIPCLLLDALEPHTVDVRALNIPTPNHELTILEKKQNHILCISSLASISNSKHTVDLDPDTLVDGDKESILSLLWRIVNSATLERIHVQRVQGLRALQHEEEEISHFLELSSEDLLIRWVNYRLSQTQDSEQISNLVEDLNDCSVYLKLQNALQDDLIDLNEALKDTNTEKRAQLVVSNCARLGTKTSHCSSDFLIGNTQMNRVFLSQLFLANPGLEAYLDSTSEAIIDGDETLDSNEGSREERTFRMWMNSVCSSMKCLSLFSESFRTGYQLLEVVNSLEPNSIDWSITFKPPFKPIVKRIKSVENCNQVIQVAKESLNLSLVGIGGDDIADGKRKPILALVWQLLRLHTLQILDSALESASSTTTTLKTTSLKLRNLQSYKNDDLKRTKLTENDVLSWANQMLLLSGSETRINSFRDPALSDSIALLDLLKAIEPQAVQDKHITQGVTPEEKEMNAKYVLSVARKLGATIFIIWEDVTEVKPKMILLLIASFMLLDKQRRKMHRAATVNGRINKCTSTS